MINSMLFYDSILSDNTIAMNKHQSQHRLDAIPLPVNHSTMNELDTLYSYFNRFPTLNVY